MINIKKSRLKMGLTQAEFASYLNITPSALSMSESGKRGLSPDAMIKIETFNLHYAKTLASKNKIDKKMLAKQEADIKKRVKRMRDDQMVSLVLTSRKMEKMAEKYEFAVNSFMAFQALHTAATPPDKKANELSWLNAQIYKTEKRIVQNDPVMQAVLSIKIKIAKAGLAICDQYLQGLKGQNVKDEIKK